MKNVLQIPLDEAFREAVAKAANDVVKTLCRAEFVKAATEEIQRLVHSNDAVMEVIRRGVISSTNDFLRGVGGDLVAAAVDRLIKSDFYKGIEVYAQKAVEESADRVVAKKLADKTVWEAKSQEAYVRNIARNEAVMVMMSKKRLLEE